MHTTARLAFWSMLSMAIGWASCWESARAQEPSRADAESQEGGGQGSFSSSEWSFELGSAYAFPGERSFGEGKAIFVALTNAALSREVISSWVDRRYILDHWIRDDETLVAYLELEPSGELLGVSWYFGPGDGCGFCSSSKIQSSVKALGGRLKGTVEGEVHDKGTQELEYAIHLALDLPIEAELPGKPLVAGGGEPGAAYLEFNRRLVAGERERTRELLDSEWAEMLKNAAAEEIGRFFGNLAELHPKRVRVIDGFVDGDRAVLRIAGEEPAGETPVKVRGEVRMDREAGAWRYDNAYTTADLEE